MDRNDQSVTPVSWGTARQEIIALQDIILDRLDKGDPITHIWHDLRSAGKLTTSKRTFYKTVRQFLIIWAEVGGRRVSGLDFHRKSR